MHSHTGNDASYCDQLVNEYHWGNFKGDPSRLMEHYYDAHLYVANWGTRRLMLRLPGDLLDSDVLDDYCIDDQLSAWTTDEFVVLDFLSEDDAGEFEFDYATEALLSAIVGVRAELAVGDLRPLYLAWLAACSARESGADALARDDDEDRLLTRVIQGETTRVRMELLRRFRGATVPTVPEPTRRGGSTRRGCALTGELLRSGIGVTGRAMRAARPRCHPVGGRRGDRRGR